MDPIATTPRTLWNTLRETLQLLALLLLPSRSRARRVYELLGTHNNLGEQSRFINLGYWREASTYDEACGDLARALARSAALTAEDEVLDVGCGFGDQDDLFRREFNPRHITGLNITPHHVDVANQRFADDQLSFQVGSATAMPFEADRFDVILGLESAFHFDTRAEFLAEAARVLRPGGRLALADVIPYDTPRGLLGWFRAWLGGGLWQVPLANFHDAATYTARLEALGFTDITIVDISADVWRPFKAYAQDRVSDPEIRERVHPMLRAIWSADHGGADGLAYILLTARAPAST